MCGGILQKGPEPEINGNLPVLVRAEEPVRYSNHNLSERTANRLINHLEAKSAALRAFTNNMRRRVRLNSGCVVTDSEEPA